jgi:protein-disulfide isomerase
LTRPDETVTIRLRRTHLWAVAGLVAGIAIGIAIGRGTADEPRPILYSPGPVSGAPAASGAAATPAPVEVETAGRPVRGPADAEVTMVEFVDFECPFCGSYARETLPRIESEYGDRIRYVSRHFPLTIHADAAAAARAAECAFEQGRYWEYHRRLFADQGSLDAGGLTAHARLLGLDLGEFDRCRESAATRAVVEKDLADGRSYGVTGTPTFFIDGQLVRGAQPFEQLSATIDAALEEG